MEKSTFRKLWAVINLASFILTIVINVLATALPLNGKSPEELADCYPNLFVPAGITFSIWSIIYTLLAAFIIIQLYKAFSSPKESSFIDKTGPFFLISCAANSLWIIAWHWQAVAVSMILMLLLLASLIILYLRLDSHKGKKSALFFTAVHLPFNVYLEWITITAIANAAALFVSAGWNRFDLSEIFWTALMISAAVIIALIMLFLRKDFAYSLVIVWALTGILIKRTGLDFPPDRGVEIAAIIGLVVLSVVIIFHAFQLFLKRKS